MADTAREPLLSEDENVRPQEEEVPPQKVSADGYLKKRNRWGFYQKRFFILDGTELTYYTNKERKKPRPALRVLGAELTDRFGAFEVDCETVKDGTAMDLDLKADGVRDAQLWVDQIERAEAVAEKAAEAEKRASLKPKIAIPKVLREMEGYLEMPSGIRFKPWQDRYFRLKNSSMLYYQNNTKTVNDYEGEIVLVDPASPGKTIVELTDTSNGRGFVVRTGGREYKFKAPTADAAKDWVSVLQERVVAAVGKRTDRSISEEKEDLPMPNQTPQWIQDWDAESDADHLIRIQRHLDNLFPPKTDPEFRKKTLNAVTVLLEELDDKARECMPVNGVRKGLTLARRESRPDIFERIIRFFHIRIVDELSQFVTDQSYNNLSVRELLRFMDLITAYDTKIKEILQGDVGQAILEHLPPFGLLDNAENMAVRYSKICESQINKWVDNVIFETCMQGEARVFVRLDGRYQTPGPTDIFNLLDQALQLGKVSGVKRLQSEIVSMSAVSFGLYAVSVTQDLVKKKADSLPYACAIANDCWSVIEHVTRLESEHRNDAYKIDFEPIREKCAAGADKCLEVLSAMVESDLKSTLEQLFTSHHLESVVDAEDAMAVVCATVDDYLEDFQILVEIQFVLRVSRMLVRDIVAYYLMRMAYAYSVDRHVSLSKREIDLIKLDRRRFVNCLQGRFPNLDIARIFNAELAALDDVIDMLTAAPALIPQTAVKICQRDAFLGQHLRPYVMNTAKMCVDLACNSSGGNDKMIKEIKALVVTELEEKIPVPASSTLAEDKFDFFDKLAYVRMWPALKKPGVKKTVEPEKTVGNVKAALKEETKITMVESVEDVKSKPAMQKQVSMQWRPIGRDGESQAQPVEMNGPPKVVLTPIITGMLKFRDIKAQAHVPYFCSIHPISETHATDYELVVFKGKSSGNPPAFRARISDIAKVAFWDELGPKHFGSDAKVVDDVPIGVGKSALEFGIAKNASEFSVTTKTGEKAHFIADSAEIARQWAMQLRSEVEKSFKAWQLTFVEGEEEYRKMSVKQLRELGQKRGLDMRGCADNLEMIRVLKNGAPLLPTATPQKVDKDSKPVNATPAAPASAATVAKPGTSTQESPIFKDPGLSLSSSMFTKKESTVGATESKPLAATVSAPAMTAAASATTASSGTAASATPARKPSELPTSSAPVMKKESLPVVAAAAVAAAAAKPTATQTTTQAAPAPIKPAPVPVTASAAPAKNGPEVVKSTTPAVAGVAPRPVATAAAVAAPAAAVAATGGSGINAHEEQLLEVQSMIVRGHMLLEEGDPVQASRLFKRAKDLAESLQSIQLKAKANAGLAASYRDQDTMRRVSGTLFEVAAHLFAISGDTSDRINCITEAADVYLRQNMKADALRVLEQYDKSAKKAGMAPVFEDRVKQIKASMA